ncbi:MAG: CDP-alcohol phosphatidyltransferase family protein [Crocinitomicaceae bacterium]|nr:CDP-alcohol phosphatidyltransferase family protein [Crocinitomicaceae bacterium]
MFNLPNLFTAANLLSGCIAIILAFAGRIDLAPFAIFAGALFDFCDGFIARKMGIQGEMGKQMDSLADMVTFGVAPGVIIFVLLTMYCGHPDFAGIIDIRRWVNWILDGEFRFAYPLIALVIPFFSLFRLAKFNLDTRQSESFIGLPTPANTLFFMSYPLVMYYSNGESEIMNSLSAFMFHPISICVTIVVMSLLLVSEIPLFSLKFKSFGIKGNEIRYAFLLISLTFIIIFKAWSLALIVFLYLVLSIVENYVLKKKEHEI